ncbi:MAG: LPS export ABC transporter permease LptF [Gammaproteobacteria bacterium]|nr:LPS export ABC transporter permease LptF [Gammaproteobacteria bacterium]MBU1655781.1 LPS export ABC transporter permease LptF [Gammaproteobacteria bacterium]MBU1960195.1 LPS export ABC transporter permease LptF [Gammaproteobacteria bacterium]
MLPILDRYLIIEVSKTLFGIVLVLVLILAGNIFILYLSRVAAGVVAHDVVLTMLGLELAKELGILLPPSFFFAVLYTLGRMYRDSEMTALSSSGVSQMRIFRGYSWLVVPLMLLSLWLMTHVTPWAWRTLQEFKEIQKNTADIANMAAGKFNESNKGDIVLYVEKLSDDKSTMKNIFIQNRMHGKLGVLKAEDAYRQVDEKTGDTFFVMLKGRRYEGNPGEHNYSVTSFDKYAVRVFRPEDKPPEMAPKMRSTSEILASNRIGERVEFQRRLSPALAMLVFAVLSIPLSRASPRQGMGGRMVLAILIYFIFFNLQAVSGSWMEKGVTPPWLGIWWVHLVMLVIAASLMLRDTPWYAARVRRLRNAMAKG